MSAQDKYHEDEFLGRWIADELSAEEHREFGAWIQTNPQEKEFFDDLKHLWLESANLSLQKGRSQEDRWDAISGQVYLPPESKSIRFTSGAWWKISAAAAAVLIFIGSYVWWSAGQVVTITAQRGERKVTVLPDGSEVNLNAESTLRYNRHAWREKRDVQFAGEGFFKVDPGAPFSVRSNFVTTEVLGTSFNLKARSHQVEVACVTGKVKVVSNQSSRAAVILTPGLETVAGNNSPPIAPRPFNLNEKTGWVSGTLYFHRTPLTEVFAEVERQAGVQFLIETSVENLTFTGRIETSNPKEALEIICLSSGLKYAAKREAIFTIYK